MVELDFHGPKRVKVIVFNESEMSDLVIIEVVKMDEVKVVLMIECDSNSKEKSNCDKVKIEF